VSFPTLDGIISSQEHFEFSSKADGYRFITYQTFAEMNCAWDYITICFVVCQQKTKNSNLSWIKRILRWIFRAITWKYNLGNGYIKKKKKHECGEVIRCNHFGGTSRTMCTLLYKHSKIMSLFSISNKRMDPPTLIAGVCLRRETTIFGMYPNVKGVNHTLFLHWIDSILDLQYVGRHLVTE